MGPRGCELLLTQILGPEEFESNLIQFLHSKNKNIGHLMMNIAYLVEANKYVTIVMCSPKRDR
jgi:hypothetical protein